MYDDDLYYDKARKSVKEKRTFHKNLKAYIGTITILFLINLFTSPFHWWFVYPAFFWGIAILMQYGKVYGWMNDKYDNLDSEDEAIRDEIERMQEQDYRRRGRSYQAPADEDFVPDLPEEELELKEFKKLRKDWDESDFV